MCNLIKIIKKHRDETMFYVIICNMIKIAQEKLLSFGMDIIGICRQIGIEPVVYGSLAYIVHTDDKVEMNDIDMLVPENYFQEIIDGVKEIPGLTYKKTDYHSIILLKEEMKIEVDGIEHYAGKFGYSVIKKKVNGFELSVIDKNTLKKVYQEGYRTLPSKREGYSYKLRNL
jgi:hypothetical protein